MQGTYAQLSLRGLVLALEPHGIGAHAGRFPVGLLEALRDNAEHEQALRNLQECTFSCARAVALPMRPSHAPVISPLKSFHKADQEIFEVSRNSGGGSASSRMTS